MASIAAEETQSVTILTAQEAQAVPAEIAEEVIGVASLERPAQSVDEVNAEPEQEETAEAEAVQEEAPAATEQETALRAELMAMTAKAQKAEALWSETRAALQRTRAEIVSVGTASAVDTAKKDRLKEELDALRSAHEVEMARVATEHASITEDTARESSKAFKLSEELSRAHAEHEEEKRRHAAAIDEARQLEKEEADKHDNLRMERMAERAARSGARQLHGTRIAELLKECEDLKESIAYVQDRAAATYDKLSDDVVMGNDEQLRLQRALRESTEARLQGADEAVLAAAKFDREQANMLAAIDKANGQVQRLKEQYEAAEASTAASQAVASKRARELCAAKATVGHRLVSGVHVSAK